MLDLGGLSRLLQLINDMRNILSISHFIALREPYASRMLNIEISIAMLGYLWAKVV